VNDRLIYGVQITLLIISCPEKTLKVKFIEERKKIQNRLKWHVHWTDGSNSWEPYENLVDSNGTKNDAFAYFEARCTNCT
jgi:hypothetical protein